MPTLHEDVWKSLIAISGITEGLARPISHPMGLPVTMANAFHCALMLRELGVEVSIVRNGIATLRPPVDAEVALLMAGVQRHVEAMDCSMALFRKMQQSSGCPLVLDAESLDLQKLDAVPVFYVSILLDVAREAVKLNGECSAKCRGLADRLRAFGPSGESATDTAARSTDEFVTAAVVLLKQNPSWSARRIAKELNGSHTTLGRSNLFKAAKAMLAADAPPEGFKGVDGEIDAADDD